MGAYLIAIITVTIFVCLGYAIAATMMAIYVSDKHWNDLKFRIWRVVSYVFQGLCLIWNPVIWILFAIFWC